MSDDYGYSERRSKKRDKLKKRKMFPYKKGGKWRSLGNEQGIVKQNVT